MVALLASWGTKVWLWVVGVAATTATLAAIYLSIRNGGRAAQRAATALAVDARTRAATQARIEAATKPMTSKEEALDPFNRDVR